MTDSLPHTPHVDSHGRILCHLLAVSTIYMLMAVLTLIFNASCAKSQLASCTAVQALHLSCICHDLGAFTAVVASMGDQQDDTPVNAEDLTVSQVLSCIS